MVGIVQFMHSSASHNITEPPDPLTAGVMPTDLCHSLGECDTCTYPLEKNMKKAIRAYFSLFHISVDQDFHMTLKCVFVMRALRTALQSSPSPSGCSCCLFCIDTSGTFSFVPRVYTSITFVVCPPPQPFLLICNSDIKLQTLLLNCPLK